MLEEFLFIFVYKRKQSNFLNNELGRFLTVTLDP